MCIYAVALQVQAMREGGRMPQVRDEEPREMQPVLQVLPIPKQHVTLAGVWHASWAVHLEMVVMELSWVFTSPA